MKISLERLKQKTIADGPALLNQKQTMTSN
jgi:hypothetical protein